VSPARFWSGVDPDAQPWKDAAADARTVFLQVYQPPMPSGADVDRITAMLDRLFSATVKEERLRREASPSTAARLRQQPALLASGGSGVALAAAMFLLAAQPDLWLSRRLARYNDAVALAADRSKRAEAARAFSALGDTADGDAVKAASLYNAATITADLGLSAPIETDVADLDLLDVLFQEHRSLPDMFHELEEGDRLAVVEALGRRGESLRQAEVALRGAVRADPADEDAGRNLEIVMKHRAAVAGALMELYEAQQKQPDLGLKRDDVVQAIIDIMNRMELPARQVEDAARDNRGYHILERF
jgi:hypothetical protein